MKEYFSFTNRQKEFGVALNECIYELVKKSNDHLVPSRNTLIYHHGSGSISTYSNYRTTEAATFEPHETIMEIQNVDIREHNTQALSNFINRLVNEMHKGFERFTFKRVSEICEDTGRSMDAKDHGSPALTFLNALKSMEFGVDRNGQISKPQFHGGSKALDALFSDLKKQGPSFENEINKIIDEKEKAALRREEQRKDRFRRQE